MWILLCEKMAERFAGDVRLNKMAKKDYFLIAAADGGEDLYVLDKADDK